LHFPSERVAFKSAALSSWAFCAQAAIKSIRQIPEQAGIAGLAAESR
jgi:hypothetical protein